MSFLKRPLWPTEPPELPAVVREGLVRLRHAMRILALAHRGAAILYGIHQLMGEPECHGLLAAIAGGLDHPAHRQCLAARRANFNRNLIRSTTHASRLHLDDRLDVVERRGEDLDRLRTALPRLLANAVQGTVDDAFGR